MVGPLLPHYHERSIGPKVAFAPDVAAITYGIPDHLAGLRLEHGLVHIAPAGNRRCARSTRPSPREAEAPALLGVSEGAGVTAADVTMDAGGDMTSDTTEPVRRQWRRLPWWHFRRVEAWLEAYPEMQREIAEKEALVIGASLAAAPDGMPRGGRGTPSDPTGVRGTRLADDWDLQKARERCKAIAETLDGMDWARRTLVRVYYWEGHKRVPWVAVAEEVRADEKTCRSWRNAIIEEIGGRLGLITRASDPQDREN